MDEVRFLRELLEVPSPSGEERAACEVFSDHAKQLGLRVRTDAAGNVHATLGSGRPHTMFLGHIDTVPGFWPVRFEGDVVHARGAVDAKGPLVAGLMAAYRTGEDVHGSRTIVAAVGEEADSRGAIELLRSPAPDALIVGEPSGWDRVTIGFRGHRAGKFRATAEPTHGSSPSLGTLDQAVDAVSRVRTFVSQNGGSGLFESCSCRTTRWTHRGDAFEECTEVDLEVRGPPGFDWASLESVAPEIAWSAPLEAVVVDKGNPAARALVAGIRSIGGRPEYLRKAGTSDMNLAARVWRVPMASYGPGDPTLDHGPREHLSLAEFSRGIEALESAFERLAAAPPG